jgi:hypothetical protein
MFVNLKRKEPESGFDDNGDEVRIVKPRLVDEVANLDACVVAEAFPMEIYDAFFKFFIPRNVKKKLGWSLLNELWSFRTLSSSFYVSISKVIVKEHYWLFNKLLQLNRTPEFLNNIAPFWNLTIANKHLRDTTLIRFDKLKVLTLVGVPDLQITDDSISKLTTLKFLELKNTIRITDRSLSVLTNMRVLRLLSVDQAEITDASLNLMIELSSLALLFTRVTGSCLVYLSKLQHYSGFLQGEQASTLSTTLKDLHLLDMFDHRLSHLVNLKRLSGQISNETANSLEYLTSLTDLNLILNRRVTDETLSKLTNLKILNLGPNKNITDNSIRMLTNLKVLDLEQNKRITNGSLKYLTNLTRLKLKYNSEVDWKTLEIESEERMRQFRGRALLRTTMSKKGVRGNSRSSEEYEDEDEV